MRCFPHVSKRIGVALLVLVVSGPAVAQIPDTGQSPKTRKRKLKEHVANLLLQVRKDAESLGLPENRIHVLKNTIEAMYRVDPEQAVSLLRENIKTLAELKTRISEEPDSRRREQLSELYANTFLEIVGQIGQSDPTGALELLRSKRAGFADQPETDKRFDELDLRLRSRLAGDDPKSLFSVGEEMLKKGLHSEALETARRLKPKDEYVAMKLMAGLTRQLEELAEKNSSAAYLARQILESDRPEYGQSRYPLDFQTRRQLIAVLVRVTVSDSGYHDAFLAFLSKMLPEIAEAAPSQLALVKAKLREYDERRKKSETEATKNAELREKGSVEDLLKAAESSESGYNHYQAAVEKFLSTDDIEGARRLIDERIKSRNLRQSLLESVENHITGKLAYDMTSTLSIDLIQSGERRFTVCLERAQRMASSNKSDAQRWLSQAEALVVVPPRTLSALKNTQRLAQTYAQINPLHGLTLVTPLFDPINAYCGATATLEEFNDEQQHQYRNGEFVFSGGQATQLVTGWATTLAALGGKNFSTTYGLIDRIERNDLRLCARLSFLNQLTYSGILESADEWESEANETISSDESNH